VNEKRGMGYRNRLYFCTKFQYPYSVSVVFWF
jgi:hypothetical protein